MATYRVVQIARRHGPGWTVEVSAPGKEPETYGFFETEAAARAAADRLAAADQEKQGSNSGSKAP